MPYLRKYNTADATIAIPVRKAGSADFATSSDWTPAAGDVKLSKDRGTQANIGTLPSYSNGRWVFSLTSTELACATLEVTIVDAATKAVSDDGFEVETYGHASAKFAADYSDAVRNGLTALPNAAAGANGGLPTVDASNNVHGLQTRAVSDASVIGTSTYSGGAVASVTGNVGGNVAGSVGSVVAKVAATLAPADVSGDLPALVRGVDPDGGIAAAGLSALSEAYATDGSVSARLADGTISSSTFSDDAITVDTIAANVLEAVAEAVRTELAVELARVDVAVSSRLASAGYSAPPSAATIASTLLGTSTSDGDTVNQALGRLADVDTQSLSAATAAGTAASGVATLLGKLTGITALRDWLRALARKSAPDATAAAEIAGTYDPATDSLEARADAGGSLTTEQAGQLSGLYSTTAADPDDAAKRVFTADALAAGAGGGGGTGDGDTAVDHDTGGTDAMRVVDGSGNGIAGVTVRAYVVGESEAEGQTVTLQDGRWASRLYLSAGVEYTIRFTLAGRTTGEATVTP